MLAVGSGEDDAGAAAREDAHGDDGRAGSRLRAVGGVCVCVCVCVCVMVCVMVCVGRAGSDGGESVV